MIEGDEINGIPILPRDYCTLPVHPNILVLVVIHSDVSWRHSNYRSKILRSACITCILPVFRRRISGATPANPGYPPSA